MKNTLFFFLMTLSPISFGADLLSSTKEVSKFLKKPEINLCEEQTKAEDDVEDSEVKMMYPCSIWDEKKDILEGITDKKKFLVKGVEQKAMVEESDIIFSPVMDLNGVEKNDIVIRSRLNITTGEQDYTVKIRPMEPKQLITTGVNEKNIKCERDVSSLDDKGEIKSQESLIADRKTISCSYTNKKSATEDQGTKDFLTANRVELKTLVPYPAIKSEKRGLKAVELGFSADYLGVDDKGEVIKLKIALERWQVPGYTAPEGCFMELSAKAPVAKMSQIGADLKAKFESKLGVRFDNKIIQGNKTGQALELIEAKAK